MNTPRRTLLLLTLLAVGVSLGFVRLGFWQLDRAQWKTTWLAQWQAALDEAPQSLATIDLSTSADSPSRHVIVEGHWLERPLVLLDNQRRDDQIGISVFRLLKSDQLSLPLLVDVGWVPWPAQRQLPPIEQLLAETAMPATGLSLTGMLVAWPGQGIKLGSSDPVTDADGRLLLTTLDRDLIQTGMVTDSPQQMLFDRLLRLDPEVPIGFARDHQALPNTLPPEKHRGYAVQWFALAAAVVITYGVLLWKFLRRRRPKSIRPR